MSHIGLTVSETTLRRWIKERFVYCWCFIDSLVRRILRANSKSYLRKPRLMMGNDNIKIAEVSFQFFIHFLTHSPSAFRCQCPRIKRADDLILVGFGRRLIVFVWVVSYFHIILQDAKSSNFLGSFWIIQICNRRRKPRIQCALHWHATVRCILLTLNTSIVIFSNISRLMIQHLKLNMETSPPPLLQFNTVNDPVLISVSSLQSLL